MIFVIFEMGCNKSRELAVKPVLYSTKISTTLYSSAHTKSGQDWYNY